VHNILGNKNVVPVQPPTRSAEQPLQPEPNKKAKSCIGQNTNYQLGADRNPKSSQPPQQPITVKANKTENPFLVANPFYLDEEEREREQERLRQEEEARRAEEEERNNPKDRNNPREAGKGNGYSQSLEKRVGANGKEWVRLGGLGANIGGDEWLQKKRKQEKMQVRR
jgi:hypothetical protein